MRLTKSQRDAVALFREFREADPTRAKKVTIELPEALMVMGHLEAVQYRTTHGNKAKRYEHKFTSGSRPLLCADPETGKLFLVDGRYHVTDRGIVDLDSNGDEIDDGGERWQR